MASLGKTIFMIVVLACLSGCTLHFKATDVELDAERQRVQSNTTYELDSMSILHGEAG
ncbi:hypothetical protein ES703_19516 [subsurface metagenome]